MTLEELQAKYEAVLLCAPALAADMADMVQDERADEREQCAVMCEVLTATRAAELGLMHYDHLTGNQCVDAIRNRNEKEVR
jgi:hypothetical protein